MSGGHLSFRAVNRLDQPGYDPGLQRHHLLPRQLLANTAFSRMFAAMGDGSQRFDDFRANGLLLPCDEQAALRMALPLHRGPHRHYSGLVIERVGQVQAAWSRLRPMDAERAVVQAQIRLDLLQGALRRFLLDSRKRRIILNRHDPLGAGIDFADLDAVADALWGATDAAVQPLPRRPSSSSLAA